VAGPEPPILRVGGLRPTRRFLLAAAPALALAPCARAQGLLAPAATFSGKPVQSGYVIVKTAPRASIMLDDEDVGEASADGLFVIGFDRDAPDRCGITVQTADAEVSRRLSIAPLQYDVQKIDGLPQDQVTPTDPALLARIAQEAKRKAAGFASDIDSDGFKGGFSLPLPEGSFRQSARFGGQRILNGVPERPHYGSDLAAPIGTPVMAPADGQVSFAETGLHYEGALILIDHGQGLVSAYLHLSKVEVAAGQKVKRGQLIGAVGKEGRATGPHLCWRMKWRGRNMDPMQMVGTPQPV
jgi:murein DD-endopeptidase MepM/ murein hydrolase activator NlpD